MTMRLGVVAEFTDRASKRMQKMLRFNRRMEKINKSQARLAKSQTREQEKLARAAERGARSFGSLGRAMSGVAAAGGSISRGVIAFSRHVVTAISKVNQLRRSLDLAARSRALLRNGSGLAGKGLGRMARGGLVAGGIVAGMSATAGAAANTVIGPAAQVEAYMIQLESLHGSSEKAQEALAWIMEFAKRTPLELPDVIESYQKLKNFGIDPTNGSLQSLVDTMAMTGGGAEQLRGIILAVGQAWTKGKLQGEEAMQLLERSVPVWDLLSKETGKTTAQLIEMASKGQLGRDAISKLVELMGTRAVGASQKMSKTWAGMISNLSDLWFQFRLLIAQAGVFEWAKEKLSGFLDTLNKMAADGSLKELAQTISDEIITTLERAWVAGKEIAKVLREIGAGLSFAADMMGGWSNLAMVFLTLPFIGTLAGIVTGLVQLGSGLAMVAAGLAGLSLPVLAVIAVVTALGAAAWWIYQNWDAVVSWFKGAWDSIVQRAQARWGQLKGLFAWHPLMMIINNWSQISTWFSGFFDRLKSNLSLRWETVKKLFSWTPLGLIINNWSSITDWVGSFFADLSSSVSSGWERVKSLFNFTWPEFEWPQLSMPNFDWPEFKLPALALPEGFSTAIENGFNILVAIAENGWSKIKAIFDAMKSAASGLGEVISSVIGTAVDAAGQALNALKGARGVDRIYEDLIGLANTSSAFNVFGSDFEKGYALTEALQAGQMSLATYRAELERVVQSGGTFAATALKMLNASQQLDAFDQGTAPGASNAANMAELERGNKLIASLKAAASALPGVIQSASQAVQTHLASIDFTYHGQRMMETIASGMRSRAHLLVTEMRRVTQAMRDHLPSSPAKVGPLSDIHRLKFSETMARSIRPEPLVKAMRRAAVATVAAATLTAPIMPAAAQTMSVPQLIKPEPNVLSATASSRAGEAKSGSGSVTVNFSPTINIQGGGDDVKDQVLAACQEMLPELLQMLEQAKSEDERLEF